MQTTQKREEGHDQPLSNGVENRVIPKNGANAKLPAIPKNRSNESNQQSMKPSKPDKKTVPRGPHLLRKQTT
jgi:hypothetical protein